MAEIEHAPNDQVVDPTAPSPSSLTITAIDLELLSLNEHPGFSTRTIQLQRARNRLAPVHSLPLELLVDIFFLVLIRFVHAEVEYVARKRTGEVPAYYAVLGQLRSVATYWEEIIQSTPSLWRFINSQDPTPLWKMALERSQPHGISVMLDTFHGYSAVTQTNDFWSTVSKEITRWECVTIMTRGGVDLSVLEKQQAPLLKKLRLVDLEGENTQTVDLFQQAAPSLRTFEMWGVSLRKWDSPILSGLHSLVLGLPDYGPSPLQMSLVLAAVPCLTNLSLKGSRFSRVMTAWPVLTPIHLPSVRILQFVDIPPSLSASLLNTLSVPGCVQFKFNDYDPQAMDDDEDDPEPAPDGGVQMFEVVSTYVKPFLKASVVASASDVEIKITALSISVGVTPLGSTSPTFGFTYQTRSPKHKILASAVRLLRTTEIPPSARIAVHLQRVDNNHLSHNGTINLLSNVHRIRSLHIVTKGVSSHKYLRAVLEALATPTPNTKQAKEGGEPRWLCSRLKHLSLCSRVKVPEGHWGNMLLRMLNERERAKSESMPSVKARVAGRPMTLESLEMDLRSGMTEEQFQAINKVLSGKSIWKRKTEEEAGSLAMMEQSHVDDPIALLPS